MTTCDLWAPRFWYGNCSHPVSRQLSRRQINQNVNKPRIYMIHPKAANAMIWVTHRWFPLKKRKLQHFSLAKMVPKSFPVNKPSHQSGMQLLRWSPKCPTFWLQALVWSPVLGITETSNEGNTAKWWVSRSVCTNMGTSVLDAPAHTLSLRLLTLEETNCHNGRLLYGESVNSSEEADLLKSANNQMNEFGSRCSSSWGCSPRQQLNCNPMRDLAPEAHSEATSHRNKDDKC